MKKFIKVFREFKSTRIFIHYRFCWIPIDEKGNGLYSVIEFFEYEKELIDKNKCEILIW